MTIRSGGATVAGGSPQGGTAAYTPGTSDQVLAAGQYLEGAQTIKGDTNLAAGNILSGVSIFGVTGALQQGYEVVAVGYYGVCRREDSSGILCRALRLWLTANSAYGSLSGTGTSTHNNCVMTWTCAAAGTYRINGYRFSPTRSGVQTMSKGQTVTFTGIQRKRPLCGAGIQAAALP